MTWREVAVKLKYREEIFEVNSGSRCDPDNVDELVEEIDRSINASHFGGQIELSITDRGDNE